MIKPKALIESTILAQRALSPISRAFLLSNVIDLASTAIALLVGAHELNKIVIQHGWVIYLIYKTLLVFVMVSYYEFVVSLFKSPAIKSIIFIMYIFFTLDMSLVDIENVVVIISLLFHHPLL